MKHFIKGFIGFAVLFFVVVGFIAGPSWFGCLVLTCGVCLGIGYLIGIVVK